MQAPRPRARLTLGVLAVGVFSYSLLQSMTVPTLPLIQRELGTDQATAAWVLTAFLISASVATPIVGRLGDSYGKQRMLLVCLVALAIGSLVAALADNIETMLVARVVQGIGGGALPLAFGIVRDELPVGQIPSAVGLLSSLLAVGFGVGIVVAGPIVSVLGYHWLFLLPTLVASASILATAVCVPESPVRSGQRISVLPALLLAGWLVSLLFGVSKAPQWGWTSPAVLGLWAGAAVLFVQWIMAERRVAIPLVDLRMMAIRGVWTSNLVAFLIGVAMYGFFGFLPQFSQTPSASGYGFDASITEAGHMMLPAAVLSFLCGCFADRLARWIGTRQMITLGSWVTAGGLFLAAFAHESKAELYAVAGLAGLGTGAVFACLANVVVEAVPPSQTGVATGMNANIRTVGGSVGAAVATTIITAELLPTGFPVERGYTQGFAFLAGSAFLAGLAALMVPGARRPAVARAHNDPMEVATPTRPIFMSSRRRALRTRCPRRCG